ncbi:MAG: 1-aminocyclopropane-1-carboxylate deaminase/D-cysteine desulfhydrase [Luteibaculum sp.]
MIESFSHNAPIQELDLRAFGVDASIHILREDLLHPLISGNKYRKLHYYLLAAKKAGKEGLLSFGGRHSNHLQALSYAAKKFGFKSRALVRNPFKETTDTLSFCMRHDMLIENLGYEEYRNRHQPDFIEKIKAKFPGFMIIPEGGAGKLGEEGFKHLLSDHLKPFNTLVIAVGTGTSFLGLEKFRFPNQRVIGMSAVPEKYLPDSFVQIYGPQLNFSFVGKGYGKLDAELIDFIDEAWQAWNLLLDPVYTAKAMQGVIGEIKNEKLNPDNLLVIHTGGLQGFLGFKDEFPWVLDLLPQALVSKP